LQSEQDFTSITLGSEFASFFMQYFFDYRNLKNYDVFTVVKQVK